MLKKIIGYTFFFYLLLAIILSLAGVTNVDLLSSSNRFFGAVSGQFKSWSIFQFGKLDKIQSFDLSGVSGILNVLVFIGNMFVVLINFLGTICNFVIQLFTFVYAIFYVIFNASDIFVSATIMLV